jgi:hypothetical protein
MRRGPSPQAARHDGDCFRAKVKPDTMSRKNHVFFVCIVDRIFQFITLLVEITRGTRKHVFFDRFSCFLADSVTAAVLAGRFHLGRLHLGGIPLFARRHLVPGSSRECFLSSAAATPQLHRGGAAGRSGAAAALLADRLADRPRVTVLSLGSLASSLVGVAALAVGGLVTVAFVL